MGEFQHNLDKKGRIIVPAKFRDELGPSMVITRWLDGCLAIYTLSQWESVNEALRKLPSTRKDSRKFMHMVMAKATQCEVDALGRILIPQTLTKEASLEKECIIVGVSDHVEIWDKVKWEAYYADASEDFEDIAEQLSEYF